MRLERRPKRKAAVHVGALLFSEARPLPFQSVLPSPRRVGAKLKAQGTGLVGVGTALRFGRSPKEAG